MMTYKHLYLILLTLGTFLICGSAAHADDAKKPETPKPGANVKDAAEPAPDGQLNPLNKQKTVLLDKENKKVILKTQVVFRAGLLEMFCCLKQTKEHESILSLDSEARAVHAGLLALGAKPGTPVQFLPEYKPPTGQTIDIQVMWRDKTGKWHRQSAQKWVRHTTRRFFVADLRQLPAGMKIPETSDLRFDPKHHELLWFGIMSEKQKKELLSWSNDKAFTKAVEKLFEISQLKPMTAEFVFAGSGFRTDEATGERYYLAESGDLICVANFSTATIDVRERSTQSTDEGLSYEAWEEHIPPLGTQVRVELIPVRDKKEAEQKSVEKKAGPKADPK